MLINKIDFLSPPITLFHLERRTHTSKVGGFFVLIMISICSTYIFYIFYDLINHKKITALFHKKFEFEAGYYSFNSTSIFHFIQIFSPQNGGYFDKFDSRYIRAYVTYVNSNFSYAHLYLYDHWVYDTCRKDIDNKYLESYLFENVENFTNSVCIRHYYNSTEHKYYKLEDKGFSWPHLEHGIAQRNNIYLTTIIQKCSNDSIINQIFGQCPSQKEIDDYLSKYFGIYMYFTDMQVDPTNYTHPVQKYLQVISSGIGNPNTFVEHYIHFSPLKVTTRLGSLFGSNYEINSFYFDFNRKGAANNDQNFFIIAKYYHLLQNNVQIYERKYNNIFDILAEIGGVVQFIFYFLYWINFIYNKYIIALDTNSLFFSVVDEKTIGDIVANSNIKLYNVQKNIIGHNIIETSNKKTKGDKSNNIKAKNNNIQFKNKEKKKIEDFGGKGGDNVTNEKTKIKNNENLNNNFLKAIFSYNNRKDDWFRLHKSNNLLLENNGNILSNKFQKLNNSLIVNLEKKENIYNNKQNNFEKKSNDDILKGILFSKGSINKMNHKRRNSKLVFGSKIRSIKYFSYFDFLKSLLFNKKKESYNFVRIFRKHLLSEEHLFKSHLKLLFLEKQLNKENENIKFIECYNEL